MLPADYLERVYAGVLGKIIGVYLGRPFEQWDHARIERELGDIEYYQHARLNAPLIVADDDITGTFTFIRALEDNDFAPDLSAADVGRNWLNYIIRNRSILWWGGMGVSTEHTAYERLRQGIEAPASGSIALNGPIVAEQIGAQIFIDGWGMVCPGDPEKAAAFARKAGSVSHDGEALHGAVVVAAMVAGAFVEPDLTRLTDAALRLIPADSLIRKLTLELRDCRGKHDNWRKGLELIHGKYSYKHFGGGCHMIPNHAVIQLALIWGEGSFHKSLMIANTAGYDTDCNSGNVGCILGIRGGLAGIGAGADLRTPVADRVLLPTAEGGSCVSDAVELTRQIARAGARLNGTDIPTPKSGAQFHFSLPGSVQGWMPEESPDTAGACRVGNELGNIRPGERELTVWFSRLAGRRVARAGTPVFILPEQLDMGGYSLTGCPRLHPGQTVSTEVKSCRNTSGPVRVRLYARYHALGNIPGRAYSEPLTLAPGASGKLAFVAPQPPDAIAYFDVGVEIASTGDVGTSVDGAVFVDHLAIRGEPDLTLRPPADFTNPWTAEARKVLRPWVNAADAFNLGWPDGGEYFGICGTETGAMVLTGNHSWRNYSVRTSVKIHLAERVLILARTGGLRRWYALALGPGKVARLLKCRDHETVLAEAKFDWPLYEPIDLGITVTGNHISAQVGDVSLAATDTNRPIATGGIGFAVDRGRIGVGNVRVIGVA
jgi:ADP-ribosylglycohydrolase